MAELWSGTAVTDVVLNVCVAELRRALGGDRARPRFIETAHRRGFRFLAAFRPEVRAGHDLGDDETAPSFLVGRDRELAGLHRFWRRACSGRRQLVMVVGDAGIGKAALVDREGFEILRMYEQGHFAPELHRIHGDAQWARGRADAARLRRVLDGFDDAQDSADVTAARSFLARA